MGLEALDEKGISMEQRSAQILTEATYLKKSNSHMKGTTLLLQYIIHDLLGYPLTDEEYIGEKNLYNHIFNYFALSNWHITGCFKKGTNEAKRPAQRYKPDADYLEKIIKPVLTEVVGNYSKYIQPLCPITGK